MAFTISYNDFFGYINGLLDGKVQRGSGRSVSTTKKTKSLISYYTTHGMKKSTARRYENLIDGDFLDFDEKEFGVQLLKKHALMIGFHNSISNTLQLIGFSKNKSLEMEYIFTPFINTSYTNSQLIDMCIEQIFKLLFNNITEDNETYYIEPENVDYWFEYKINNNHIKVYNALYKANANNADKLKETILSLELSDEKLRTHDLFYHTTTWEYAMKILNKINHNAGRTCLDFGVNPGFYLGTRMGDTIEWGEYISYYQDEKSEIATIIFLIPKVYPRSIKYKKLAGDEWIKITALSRRCITPQFKNEVEGLENIDLVYGPIVKNVENIKKDGAKPRAFKDKNQLVSKTDKGDQFLQPKIIGVLFYRKN